VLASKRWVIIGSSDELHQALTKTVEIALGLKRAKSAQLTQQLLLVQVLQGCSPANSQESGSSEGLLAARHSALKGWGQIVTAS